MTEDPLTHIETIIRLGRAIQDAGNSLKTNHLQNPDEQIRHSEELRLSIEVNKNVKDIFLEVEILTNLLVSEEAISCLRRIRRVATAAASTTSFFTFQNRRQYFEHLEQYGCEIVSEAEALKSEL